METMDKDMVDMDIDMQKVSLFYVQNKTFATPPSPSSYTNSPLWLWLFGEKENNADIYFIEIFLFSQEKIEEKNSPSMVLPHWCVGTTLVHSTRNDPLYFPLSTSKHPEKSLNIGKTTLDVLHYISKAASDRQTAPDTLKPPLASLSSKCPDLPFKKSLGPIFALFRFVREKLKIR